MQGFYFLAKFCLVFTYVLIKVYCFVSSTSINPMALTNKNEKMRIVEHEFNGFDHSHKKRF